MCTQSSNTINSHKKYHEYTPCYIPCNIAIFVHFENVRTPPKRDGLIITNGRYILLHRINKMTLAQLQLGFFKKQNLYHEIGSKSISFDFFLV